MPRTRLIGPRRKSGAFYKKRPNWKSTKKVSMPMKKAIKKIINSKEETKYHAEQLITKQSLDWGIHTPWTPSSIGDTMPLVPRIALGDGSFQRVGSKVRPVKCRVDIEAAIQEAAVGLTPINVASEDIYMVMYILRPRTSKNFYQFTNPTTSGVTGGAYTDDLLDNGDGTNKPFGFITTLGGSPFVFSNASDLQLPVNRDYFTLIKKRVVRLTKNSGTTNGDGSNAPLVSRGSSSYRGSFYYKLPTLRYDDDAKTAGLNQGYPTNANMVLCVGAALANNMDSIQYVGGEPSSILVNPIMLNIRTHYWYKDS